MTPYIIITMVTSDPAGELVLTEGNTKFGEISSRVSRQATLDGGCVVTNGGVCDGDRTFSIDTKATEAQKAAFEYIHRNSNYIIISCRHGLFYGAISYINLDDGIKATILVKSKEA